MGYRSIHLSLHIHKDAAAMAERAAHIFAAACEEAVSERGQYRVAISGGHTPVTLFRLLTVRDWADKLPWDKISIYWVDERCVGPTDPESNYGVARRELLSRVPITNFYRMRGDQNPEQAATDYERLLKADFGLTGHELPRFDMMLLGMGADGHTASLFPGSPALEEKNRLVIETYVPSRHEDRITLTLPVINNSRCCMFLVSGAEKRAALGDVLDLLSEPALPAQRVRPGAGDLIWIVDEAAASGK